MTALDDAYAAMETALDDDAARLRYYERLADSELFLLLKADAEGEQAAPELFPLDNVSFVLAFDREDRLTAFTARPAPYAAMSGRTLAGQLAGQGVGIAVNLDAPSANLLPPEAVDWLAKTLGHVPQEVEERITAFAAPRGLPEILLTALDRKLALAEGLALSAYLAEAELESGAKSHILAFVDAVPGAEPALARAAGEALTFSGLEAGVMDVAFLRSTDSRAAALARHGLRFDLPQPQVPERIEHVAPGSDPDKPPILR